MGQRWLYERKKRDNMPFVSHNVIEGILSPSKKLHLAATKSIILFMFKVYFISLFLSRSPTQENYDQSMDCYIEAATRGDRDSMIRTARAYDTGINLGKAR